MKKKKVLALTMAVAMLFGSSLSVFAAGGTAEDTTGETVTGEGKVDYVDTTVYSVTLPTTGTINLVVDPQGLAGLEDGDSATLEDLSEYAGKISCASTPVVTNLSSVPMKISVKLTLTGDATSVSSGDAVNTGTDNNVLLYAVPSAVDTLGVESNYVASSTGIVMDATPAIVDFVLPAAEYSLTKTVSGSDASVSYALADGETGHGTGLSFEGYVNKNADWSDYAGTPTKQIGMTAVFTFTNTLGGAEADSTDGAPFGMVAYSGVTVEVEPGDAEPSLSDVTYVAHSGTPLTIPYSLGAGESRKGEVTDFVLVLGTFVFSKNGGWSYPTTYADKFDIQAGKIVIASDFMDFFDPSESDIYIIFDDDQTDFVRAKITVTE